MPGTREGIGPHVCLPRGARYGTPPVQERPPCSLDLTR